MISNIMEFDDKVASEVMTHRKNIQAFEVNTPLRDAAIAMANERFSRYPIYEEEMDNIVGILHIKDVLKFLLAFIPETKSIDKLFKEMQVNKNHIAVVISEYGQTSGIVTMEDILEEIVGNILDEYDVDEHFIQEIGDHTYLMRGLTELSDVEDVLDIRFKDDFDTLNGFLISKLEHIPSIHEKPSIHYQGYCFEIVGMADNIIDMVRVSKSESF